MRPLSYTRPVGQLYLTVDTSPYAAGWALSQLHPDGRHPARFGARTLNSHQIHYSQVKRELFGLVQALKAERHYLFGADFIVETDCAPLLGMITAADTPDVHMLRWVLFVRTFNPHIIHISGTANVVADMLSRAAYPSPPEVLVSALSGTPGDSSPAAFYQEQYADDLRLLNIGLYLSTQQPQPSWTPSFFRQVRRSAHGFLLLDGLLWVPSGGRDLQPRRVVGLASQRDRIVDELHSGPGSGHRGRWATLTRVTDRYFWKGMTAQVLRKVATCPVCQRYAKRVEREPMVASTLKGLVQQWVLDLCAMPRGSGGERYLVIARDSCCGYPEARALRTKRVPGICRFILEDIIARYGAPSSIRADNGELDAQEARSFFARVGVDLSLTTAYNPEANGRSERGHAPIVSAIIKACDGSLGSWPSLLPMALWADRSAISRTTGFAPAELMYGFVPTSPIETTVPAWTQVVWRDGISHEDLLALRIRQLENRAGWLHTGHDHHTMAREIMRRDADSGRRLRSPLRPGDWVLLRENQLDNQHSTNLKFAPRWRGPFVVVDRDEFATYRIRELSGAEYRRRVPAKRLVLFQREGDSVLEDAALQDPTNDWDEDFSPDSADTDRVTLLESRSVVAGTQLALINSALTLDRPARTLKASGPCCGGRPSWSLSPASPLASPSSSSASSAARGPRSWNCLITTDATGAVCGHLDGCGCILEGRLVPGLLVEAEPDGPRDVPILELAKGTPLGIRRQLSVGARSYGCAHERVRVHYCIIDRRVPPGIISQIIGPVRAAVFHVGGKIQECDVSGVIRKADSVTPQQPFVEFQGVQPHPEEDHCTRKRGCVAPSPTPACEDPHLPPGGSHCGFGGPL